VTSLARLVQEIEDTPLNLRERIEALDRLEAHLIAAPEDTALYRDAKALQEKLETTNFDAYESIRQDIREGRGRESLLPHLSDAQPDREGYDELDEIIAGVLQFDDAEPTTELASEMVAYQPTPARHIFDLFEKIALTSDDVLIDIGSGLGHVPILASIWTGARAIGVELEPAYVACARRVAESLRLKSVTFLRQDACATDFSIGNVFYLYTPFSGAILRATLDLLQCEAKRAIRIGTFGPCTAAVAAEEWLATTDDAREDRISIFRPR
jgi:hypothetical protein